jgi:hypothetical protein
MCINVGRHQIGFYCALDVVPQVAGQFGVAFGCAVKVSLDPSLSRSQTLLPPSRACGARSLTARVRSSSRSSHCIDPGSAALDCTRLLERRISLQPLRLSAQTRSPKRTRAAHTHTVHTHIRILRRDVDELHHPHQEGQTRWMRAAVKLRVSEVRRVCCHHGEGRRGYARRIAATRGTGRGRATAVRQEATS